MQTGAAIEMAVAAVGAPRTRVAMPPHGRGPLGAHAATTPARAAVAPLAGAVDAAVAAAARGVAVPETMKWEALAEWAPWASEWAEGAARSFRTPSGWIRHRRLPPPPTVP